MKIVLISPYANAFSFGTRTLSSCLKKYGHNVKVIFLCRNFWERYDDQILAAMVELSRGADLIGISLMTNFFDNAVQITQRLKRDLDIPILWGGIHPTIRPQECLDYADLVCLGEGEEALIELVKKMEEKQDYRHIPGIWAKDKNSIITNKIRPLIQDLDSIPFPDYYDYENHYILDGKCIQKMSEALLNKYSLGHYMTMPTRGCPFGCSYCCNNTINKMHLYQKIVRKRSVDNVIKELLHAKDSWPGMLSVYFDDDAFFLYTPEELREFGNKYKKNIGLPLGIGGITPSTLTREKLSLLVDAGLKSTRMGIQSASESTKKLYRRNYPNQLVLAAARIINEFKDKIDTPQYDILIGNPWEKDEDLIKTLIFLTKLPRPYYFSTYLLTLYPETELYNKAKQEGLITNDLEEVYRKSFRYYKPTYLESLFFLLNKSRGRISTKTMTVLTSRSLRRLKLNWILYFILLGKFVLFEGLKAVRKGDLARIKNYIKSRLAFNS